MKKLVLAGIVASSLIAGSLTIPVLTSEPIYSNTSNRVQVGYTTRTKRVRVQCENYRDTNSVGIDTLIGIGAGIAIGNQIGRGRGREAAKVGGAIIGGYTANHMRGNSGVCYEEREYRVPRYHNLNQMTVTGYRNCGYLKGIKICKTSRYKKSHLTVSFYAR